MFNNVHITLHTFTSLAVYVVLYAVRFVFHNSKVDLVHTWVHYSKQNGWPQ